MNIVETFFALTKEKSPTMGTYVVVIMILFFSVALIYHLFVKRKRLFEAIKKEQLKNDKELAPIWLAYQKTFVDYKEFFKTNHHAKEFFSEYAVLNVKLDMRFLSNVSSSLVGIGVLGTFIGLSLGISSIQLTDTETIKSGINGLLKGMGTAFTTSIWGMFLSILFTITYKYQQTKISKKINELCLFLDSEYKIELKDLEKIQTQKQKEVIHELFNEYLVADTDEGKQLPKNVFRQLLEESQNQTRSLSTLADDLGENLTETLEGILDKLIEDNSSALTSLIEDKLMPVLNELKDIKQDSGTEIIEKAIDNLATSMQTMMLDFKQEVSGSTKEEMEQLSLRLSTVSESLIAVPDMLKNVSGEISETIGLLKSNVIDEINKSKEESKKTHKENKDLFTNANTAYKETLAEVNKRMDNIVSEQKNNLLLFETITKEIQVTINDNKSLNQDYKQVLSGSKDIVSNINAIATKFQINSEHIDKASANLLESINKHKEEVLTVSNSQTNLLVDINKAVSNSQKVSQDYVTKFETIEKGLSGIFNELQKGLVEYQTTTSGTLNEYLQEFSTAVKDSHTGLSSIVGSLDQMVDDLTESVDNLKKAK